MCCALQSCLYLQESRLDIAFHTGLFGSMVLYRLFFHPLRNFPGPVGARISRLHASFLTLKTAQMHYVVQDMHRQYGDVVRTGPREVSICRPSAIRAIYGPPTRCTKSPWYDQNFPEGVGKPLIGIRDPKTHNKRRRVWDRGFRIQALNEYEPRIVAKTRLLVSKINERHAQPLNITNWISCYAFDVMGDIALGMEFDMLKHGQKPPAVKQLQSTINVVAVGGTIPWLAPLVMDIPGVMPLINPFRRLCHLLLEERRQTVSRDEYPKDIISWLIQAKGDGDPGAAPSEIALQDDAWTLVVAGSDTVSTALTNALFYLSTHPTIFSKLQSELDNVFPHGMQDWSYDIVRDIKYLDYIINETLRLKPSVPGGLARVTPPEGLQIDDIYIPGDMIVTVPTFTIQRNERYFTRAREFIPERWEGVSTESVPFIPFSRGTFDCAGNNIAWMELRMVLSTVALEYHVCVADDAHVAFDGQERDAFMLALPDLFVVFKTRR
ncbi:cytochrome P450 [Aspergillus glaucus CBS 516.65]|uniref:Cytochrome P450 n=1 Tax=Aspergillus glaucus CBS 516.65 TaxID=1160497 RepID=A0A1L9VYL8_ASPGL|nr:hypothetical protein ASPGLDRAFT_62619 [Aspergillus glaucus CBS 516.65]OJJ89023.1 hypothetical protein ASPGLDRAFT_62619 [Aspergillus glaucus CBS 516.65]